MTNRRQFIHASVAASVSAALVGSSTLSAIGAARGNASANAFVPVSDAPAAAPHARLPLHVAVVDVRFADGVSFCAAARQSGIASHAIRGDVTSLWYHELHPRWQQNAVPIAGLTTHGPLFCLERLAWDHDMRVIYRGTHQRVPDGTVHHLLESSAREQRLIEGRLSGRQNWPAEIAALIANLGPGTAPIPLNLIGSTRVECVTQCTASRGEPDQPLFSWVIAPRERRVRGADA